MNRFHQHQQVVNAALAARLPNLSDAHYAAVTDELARAKEMLDKTVDQAEMKLEQRLGLSNSEMCVLTFLAAVAESHETAELAARFAPNGLTIEALRKLVFGDAGNVRAFRELSAAGKLRELGLITRNDGGSEELHESRQTWKIADRVLAWLYGDESIDPSLTALLRPAIRPGTSLSISEETVTQAVAAMRSSGSVVVVHGKRGLGRRSLIALAASEAAVELFEIDARLLSPQREELEPQLYAIARECKLLGHAPLFCNLDELEAERIDLIGRHLVAVLETNVFVTCGVQRPQLRWNRPVIAVEVKSPSSAQRAVLWKELLSAASEGDAEYLASQYPLAPALMHGAARAALARAGERTVTSEDIEQGIRAVLDDKLGNFAKRIEVTQQWDDLVIDPEQAQSVTELIARIRQRRTVYEQWGFAAKVGKGLGVAALFSGPPGTGKTMIAALIAKELKLELYQVDMAKITSKFIGETEKHLGDLFDAAEAGHAILLFDEADSLFGKRTEVKSSNDRYANLETNYVLQRLESFTGICLLTSNHESNIDPAFQRRLSLHLRFQVPDEDERAKLWRAMLPAAAPVAPNLDVGGLAQRFEMSGGYIRNAALRAAFLAAEEGTPIMNAHLEHAARLEYEGMGKIVAPRGSQWPQQRVSSL